MLCFSWIPCYTDVMLHPKSIILDGCAAAAASHATSSYTVISQLCDALLPQHTQIHCCIQTPAHYKDALLLLLSLLQVATLTSGCAAATASPATQVHCCISTPTHYKDALLLHPLLSIATLLSPTFEMCCCCSIPCYTGTLLHLNSPHYKDALLLLLLLHPLLQVATLLCPNSATPYQDAQLLLPHMLHTTLQWSIATATSFH